MAKGLLQDIATYVRADMRASLEFWHRGEAMGAIVGAVIALAVTLAGLWGVRVTFNPQSADFWATAIGAYLFVLLLVVTPFRMWREQQSTIRELVARHQPKLQITFQNAFPWVRDLVGNVPSRTNLAFIKKVPCKFVRFRVASTQPGSIVRGCKAYLRDVQFLDAGTFTRVFSGTLQLRWAEQQDARNWLIDIPSKAEFYVDLFSTDEEYDQVFVKWESSLIVNEELFVRLGRYRFVVFVSSEDGGADCEATFDLDWRGKWNDIDVKMVE